MNAAVKSCEPNRNLPAQLYGQPLQQRQSSTTDVNVLNPQHILSLLNQIS